jgi:hypothetical protein
MTEFLCKEIIADIIGSYLIVYRDTCAFRQEYEPAKIAKRLIFVLTQRSRNVIKIFTGRAGKETRHNKNARSVFLVDNQCLVSVIKVVHLRKRDREGLEKQLAASEYAVGLALNFGSRSPEFWRVQKTDLLGSFSKPEK